MLFYAINGQRVTIRVHGPGTIVKPANPEPRYAKSTVAVVQFDSGKRYACLARRLRPLDD